MWWILIETQVHLVENQTLFTFKILHQNCTNLLSPSPAQCFVPFIYISILISLNSVHLIFFTYWCLKIYFSFQLLLDWLDSLHNYFLLFSFLGKNISCLSYKQYFLCTIQSPFHGYYKMNASSITYKVYHLGTLRCMFPL